MIELQEGYYLNYFELMLEEVVENYSDIFTEDERNFISTFSSLENQAKKLYLRLFMRVGPWFVRDQLNYIEIGDLDFCLKQLKAKDFITDSSEESDPGLWKLFKVGQLRHFLTDMTKRHTNDLNSPDKIYEPMRPSVKDLTKDALIAEILLLPESLRRSILEETKLHFIKPLQTRHASLIPLLFFGNHSQGMTDFILEDIGQRTFEKINIDRTSRVFPTREHLDRRRYLRKWKDVIQEAQVMGVDQSDEGSWNFLLQHSEEVLKETDSWPESDRKSFAYSFLHWAQYLEKKNHMSLAIAFYQRTRLPPSRERQARYWYKLKKPDTAAHIVLEMFDFPLSLDEKNKAIKLLSKWKIDFKKISTEDSPQFLNQHICCEIEKGKVEESVLNYYQANGWNGMHIENLLWSHFFGMILWSAIFSSSPGAFANRFQAAPLDMWGPNFYLARKKEIDEIVSCLFQSQKILSNHLEEIYQSKKGIFNAFTNWSEDVHAWCIKLVELSHLNALKSIVFRILDNPGDLLKGFPDLILENALTKELMLVEVKGPGDRLRSEQIHWLDHFTAIGMRCEVAWAKPIGETPASPIVPR